MSSLAAARADNFYYPPGFDPDKHGSLNKFQGQHPLRERAKKLDQGILVIRFEVPFNIWCLKCGEHVAKGVRFNAEKKQVGNYLSTKIWSFSMRHHCGSNIVIQTDPKNAEYLVMEGARKKVETYSAADAETVELPGEDDKAKMDDPFFKLEHGTMQKAAAKARKVGLVDLREASEARHKDDYKLNKALRAQLREAKKADRQLDERRKQLNLPEGMRLLPESEADAQEAGIALMDNDSKYKTKRKQQRHTILQQSIFGPSGHPATTPLGVKVAGKRAVNSLQLPSTVSQGVKVAGKRGAAALQLPSKPVAKRSVADRAAQLAARRT